ncbi:MAG: Trk system potassium transporter TrkA [Parachlamydiales bacterium]|nr:Trk system potassium transporter TrkA [Parachlamydiales bacterium]
MAKKLFAVNAMNIVILGAGDIGSHLAAVLSDEEHNVTVIDKEIKNLERLQQQTDVATLHGYGAEWKLLDTLIENAPDCFIAMTGDDETNLVACSIAKNLGYPQTIARIKEIGYLKRSRLDFSRLFYVDYFIGSEMLTAYDILKSIIRPDDLAVENFAHGIIQMRSCIVSKEWNKEHLPISELSLPDEILISLIRRIDPKTKKEMIIFPHGHDHILHNDEITVIGETKAMLDLHTIFPIPHTSPKNIVMIGGNRVAVQLARILEKMNITVTIIEKEEMRCQELANLLTNTQIINHNGLDLKFLQEKQVYNADILICSTSNDETNALLSLLGKKTGCKKIISLISDISIGPILRSLDITVSLSERVSVANKVLSILHAESIISIASLCDNQAQVLEMKISSDSPLLGIPLSQLSADLPKELIIAAIENRGRVMIGKGNRILSPNDTIILITSPKHMHEIQEIF